MPPNKYLLSLVKGKHYLRNFNLYKFNVDKKMKTNII